jgi:endonuclease/exonuclease/phosphatase family metal-dependent hydrolase
VDVLTWNIFHGLSAPRAGRSLFDDYAELIAGWSWDVALLQEVPPWWALPLAERTRASMRMRLTNRFELPALRERLTRLWPDGMQVIGGGSNVILVRDARILEHRTQRLRIHPMRRWMHAVRLDSGAWAGNLHSQTRDHESDAPKARPEADLRTAVTALLGWAGEAPAFVGGDFNLRSPAHPAMARAKGPYLDHVLARGLGVGAVRTPESGTLSDHPPVLVSLRG